MVSHAGRVSLTTIAHGGAGIAASGSWRRRGWIHDMRLRLCVSLMASSPVRGSVPPSPTLTSWRRRRGRRAAADRERELAGAPRGSPQSSPRRRRPAAVAGRSLTAAGWRHIGNSSRRSSAGSNASPALSGNAPTLWTAFRRGWRSRSRSTTSAAGSTSRRVSPS